MMKNIYIFYHVLLTDNLQSIGIVSEQLNTLMVSGLLGAAEKIFIGAIYGGDNKEILNCFNNIIKSFNINNNIELVFINKSGDESSTLTYLKMFANSLQDNNYFLYFHTKGVTHLDNDFFLPTKYWRHYLEYFNIIKWKNAVDKLNSGYDSCGALWINDKLHPNLSLSDWENKGFYAGTFFWLTKNLIDQIPYIYFSNSCTLGRYCVEAIPSIIPHNFYILDDNIPLKSNIDMYNIVYSPLMYQYDNNN